MKYVNILNSSDCGAFLRQRDPRIMSEFSFYENSAEDIDWDYVIVFEEMKHATELRCRRGGLVFISGEPEDARYYCKPFLKQFDILLSSHSRLMHWPNHYYSNTALNWHYGYSHKKNSFSCDFNDLLNFAPPAKSAEISVITSTLTKLRGHLRRVMFLEDLKKRYGSRIDFFGRGANFIDDKAEALLPYRFHIALENSTRNHYWTEKLSDPILAYAVPIYDGAPNIGEYFSSSSMHVINIDDRHSVFELIDSILENPEQAYLKKLPALAEARKLLLDKYNFYSVLNRLLNANPIPQGSANRVVLRNNIDFPEHLKGRFYRAFIRNIKKFSYRIFKK